MRLNPETVRFHGEMLNDSKRTSSFLSAIHEVVKRGDIVVDIGTGTGVLAVGACNAGAQTVYAIESGAVHRLAKEVADRNGLGTRIKVINCNSRDVRLRDKADVVIAELIGNDPFAEKILSTTWDSRKRLLKAGGKIIPCAIRVFALGLFLKSDWFITCDVAKRARNWKNVYKCDLAPVVSMLNRTCSRYFINPYSLRKCKFYSRPTLLAEATLGHVRERLAGKCIIDIARKGVLNAVALPFEAHLSSDFSLSTLPNVVRRTNHWTVPVWVINPPYKVKPKDRFSLHYAYRENGDNVSLRIERL